MVANPFSDGLSVAISSDTSGFDAGIDGATSKLGGFKLAVGAAGAALAGLAAGGLAASIDAARQFEEAVVELEKVTNSDVAAKMEESIKSMAAEIPQTQEQLAGIAATAGRLGVEGADNIERFTRVTAEIATATDLAANEAADSFARIATLTNEPIENIRSLGDVVNELSNTMGASASEITDAMTRSAGALSQLGISTENVAALNATMNEVSSSARIAGTRLRRFAQELQDPGNVEDLSAALGLTTEEFKTMREESPVELMELMARRFKEGGEEADALRSTLSTTSRATLAGLSQNLDSLTEAQRRANQQMREGGSLTEEFQAANSTFNAQLQRTENQLRNVAITTGQVLLPALSNLLGSVSEGIQAFSKFNERTGGQAAAFGLLGTAIAGVGVALLSFVGGPITIAIAAVAALAAAYSQNIGGIQDRVNGLLRELRKVFGNRAPALLDAFRQFWNVWGDEIIMVGEGVAKVVGVLIDLFGTALINAVDLAASTITAILQLLSGDFEGAADTMVGAIERALQRTGEVINELTGGVFEDLVNGLLETINKVGRIIQEGADALGIDLSIPEFEPVSLTDIAASDTTMADFRQGEASTLDNVPVTEPQPGTGAATFRNGEGQREQTVNVTVEGDTDVVRNVSAEVIEQQKRRAVRNTGGVTNPN